MNQAEALGAIKNHYPYVTRSLLELYGEGVLTNVKDVLVEPAYGYTTRISYTEGGHRITYGNDLGLNTSSASELANDKGHTKFLLRALGISCPRGEELLLPWWAETVSGTGRMRGFPGLRTTASADAYIASELGYPVYVKPIDGSKGANVYKVHAREELAAIFDSYEEKRVRVAMIEEPLAMPDYRIVTLDGEPISVYQRRPLMVMGDGRQNIRQLLESLQDAYVAGGRDTRIDTDDPRIAAHLRKKGYDLDFVPSAGSETVLSDISNLSAGGTSEDVSAGVHRRWTDLAAGIARNFNLRLCGVDLCCANIGDPDAAYSVLEVNASPGLDHYASSGEEQRDIVRRLYAKVFNTLP